MTNSEDFILFKDYCKLYLGKEYEQQKASVIQSGIIVPSSINRTTFVEEISYMLCYNRECFYKMIRYIITNPKYYSVAEAENHLLALIGVPLKNRTVLSAAPDMTREIINTIIDGLYPVNEAKFYKDAIQSLKDRIHPVECQNRTLLLERLNKTMDTTVYSFKYRNGLLTASKDYELLDKRKKMIKKELRSFTPNSKVLDALAQVVTYTMTIAGTLWGESEKINPDLADCHCEFKNPTMCKELKLDKTTVQNIREGNNTLLTPIQCRSEVSFSYQNLISTRFVDALSCEINGKRIDVYEKDMEVVEHFIDIYKGIPKSVLKKIVPILHDTKFLALVNKLINETVPGYLLDAKYTMGLGVEICFGKRFKVKHNTLDVLYS